MNEKERLKGMSELEENANMEEVSHWFLNRNFLGRCVLRVWYCISGASYETRESGWSASTEKDEWTAVVKTGPGYIGRAGRRVNKLWSDFMNTSED